MSKHESRIFQQITVSKRSARSRLCSHALVLAINSSHAAGDRQHDLRRAAVTVGAAPDPILFIKQARVSDVPTVIRSRYGEKEQFDGLDAMKKSRRPTDGYLIQTIPGCGGQV